MSINKNLTAFTLRTHKGKIAAAAVAALCTAGIGAGFVSYFEYKQVSAPGWHTGTAGKYYIMRSTGDRAVGLKLINNATYLFDKNGIMKTGWQKYDENTYYFDQSGVMQKGIVQIDMEQPDGSVKAEDFYFSDESGLFRTGLQDFNGQQYYFDEHGFPGTGFTKNGENYYDKEGKRVSGWAKINDVQYYFYEDGEKAGRMAKGWTDIKDPDSGETFTYYFYPDGHMATGVSVIKGAAYSFGDDGALFKGWTKLGKFHIYADEKTGAFAMGLKKIGDDYYYFDTEFHMITGWVTIGGKKYLFDDDGKMLHDCWYDENKEKYYFTEDGSAASGFIKLDYDYYFFDPTDNALHCNGWENIAGDWYLFNEGDGKVQQGFYNFKGYWWFFERDTHRAATGLTITVDYTSEQKKEIKRFKSDLEKLSEFGNLKKALSIPDLPPESAEDYEDAKKGFINTLVAAGYSKKEAEAWAELWTKYETAESYGYINATAYAKLGEKLFGQHFFGEDHVVKTGWQTQNGLKFYFDPVTGEKVTGWKTLAGDKYYFGEFGVCAYGKVKVDGKVYDFGTTGHLPSGATKVGNVYKYMYSDGRIGTNIFGRSGDKMYYFDANGNTMKGWQYVNGALYYFGSQGEILTGWQRYNSDRIYMSEQGALRNSWLNLNGATYYFDSNYHMVTNWTEIDGDWFYFGADGKLKNGWTIIDGRKYYLDHGLPLRGPFHADGQLYVTGSDGYVQEGWISWNNNLYYADENGLALANTSRRVGDGFYTFNANGEATRMS